MASGDYVGYTGGPQFQLPEKQRISEPQQHQLQPGEQVYDAPRPDTAPPSYHAGITPQTYYPPPPELPSYGATMTPAASAYSSDQKQSYFPETSQQKAWSQTPAAYMPPTPEENMQPISEHQVFQKPETLPESQASGMPPSIAHPGPDPMAAPKLNHSFTMPVDEHSLSSTSVQVLHEVENPHRPGPGIHHYTEPYIGSAHPPSQQGPVMHTPQFQDPYVPQYEQPTTQIGGSSAVIQPTDETKNHGMKRFIGNMVYVRAARSSVQTVVSSAKLPFYLSPWGDNNPITLPNVRKRDVAFFGLAFFGLEALGPGMVEVVGPLIHNGIHATTEAIADETVSKMTKGKAPVVNSNAGTVSIQLRITHKLIGQEASISFMGERENTENRMDCSKGWFCPYLYASCRLPQIPRNKDFAVAQFYSPGLAADAAIAPTFLSALQIGHPVAAICPHTSPSITHPTFRRMAILFVGIAPFRTASAWSQSRIPNEARLTFHLMTHIPAIVVPVTAAAPVCAWSPWTMAQMISGGGGYDADRHYYELLGFLETVVDEAAVDEDKKADWRIVVAHGLLAIIRGIQELDRTLPSAKAFVNPGRAGIAMFRF